MVMYLEIVLLISFQVVFIEKLKVFSFGLTLQRFVWNFKTFLSGNSVRLSFFQDFMMRFIQNILLEILPVVIYDK